MNTAVLTLVLALAFFLFADSIFTPLVLLLWKKIWLSILKIQALLTKKNLLQALVQSLVLAGKAILRLINKTVTYWILPLLMTRRQRYWLHHAILDLRRWQRMRLLRGRVRWRRLPFWLKAVTVIPGIVVAAALFVASGFLLAGLFGVSFVVPWLGGLPLATIVFFRRQLARLALFVFERMGVGAVVGKVVDRAIDLIWWQTPEPMQRRFDLWWQRFKNRLRRRVIGPRRKVTRRLARFRLHRKADVPTSAGKADDRRRGNARDRSEHAAFSSERDGDGEGERHTPIQVQDHEDERRAHPVPEDRAGCRPSSRSAR